MHIKPKNVFKAICYGHGCSIERGGCDQSRASLVDISSSSARLLLLTDPETDSETLLRRGESVHLHPQFLHDTGFESISSRVGHVNGNDVTLHFETPLPFTSSTLFDLTNR